MATERVKVFEEKSKGLPIWAWLLPLLLLLALLAWFLSHRHRPDAVVTTSPTAPIATTAATTTSTLPDLGAVHFDTDKATLTSDGQATLTRAAEYMKQNPKVHLRLEGYTDATGTEPHNATLSDQRAMTAGKFLEGQGIERSRLTGGGFGPAKPVSSNDTASGKADNRRVELFEQP